METWPGALSPVPLAPQVAFPSRPSPCVAIDVGSASLLWAEAPCVLGSPSAPADSAANGETQQPSPPDLVYLWRPEGFACLLEDDLILKHKAGNQEAELLMTLGLTLDCWCSFKMGPTVSSKPSSLPWGGRESALCVELGRRRDSDLLEGPHSFPSDPQASQSAGLTPPSPEPRHLDHLQVGENTQSLGVGIQNELTLTSYEEEGRGGRGDWKRGQVPTPISRTPPYPSSQPQEQDGCKSDLVTPAAGSVTGTTGSMQTVEMEKDETVSDCSPHIANIGRLVEDMENKIRSTLNEIYFGKTKDIVNGL
ncbi:hypothetical protein P7K49_015584, partial [Saguinus oedipus]